jgi:hypothetical protein
VIGGYVKHYDVLDRSTPYHYPHSTQVAGSTVVHGGDDRYYNNLMLGEAELPSHRTDYLGSLMDKYTTEQEYREIIGSYGNRRDHDKYLKTPQPVWFESNAYSGLTKPFRAEVDPIDAKGMTASIDEENGEWILTINAPAAVANAACRPVTTARLGAPRITEEAFENPDGTSVDFTLDLLGNVRAGNVIPGPIAALKEGAQRIVVWKR